jgi:UDP-2,3-diacylglucosamine hydrolase
MPNLMPHSLFISDLHLGEEQARSMADFRHFAANIAPRAEALYILGDLFEYWAGDDDSHDPFHSQVISTLRGLAEREVEIYLLRGNRDLLMGTELAAACKATLLDDPTLLNLYGTNTLLCHGDTLCTDDIEYQKFRVQVHDKTFQKDFLAQPLAARKAHIEGLRRHSTTAKQHKIAAVMDVNEVAVAALLRAHQYPRLIHGHTHRPNRHEHIVDGYRCERWVLGDWYQRGSALRCDSSGCHSIAF